MSADRPDHGIIDVAIAIVRRDGLWLVAKRHVDAHLGGLWEFPGGKLHDGESAADAALRELMEECLVTARAVRELPSVQQAYDDRTVRIHPLLCDWVEGEALPVGNEVCRWVTSDELVALDMPALNGSIIRAALAL